MGQVRAAASAPLLLLLALLLLQPARALYFLLGKDGAEKCFVEEMPAATMAVARYQNADWSPANDNYVHIAVKDIDEGTLFGICILFTGLAIFALGAVKGSFAQSNASVNDPLRSSLRYTNSFIDAW